MICGWTGTPDQEEPKNILSRMLGAKQSERVPAPSTVSAVVLRACAMGARAEIVPVEVRLVGNVLAAITGRPVWKTAALGALAFREGNALALAEAYERHGTACVEHISGSFSIAIVDSRTTSGLIAVDRMGISTLCYANPHGGLVFGSDAESVAAHPSVGRELDLQGLYNYLYCHVVPSPGTIFRAVNKLRPGECVVFGKGPLERRFYWQLRYPRARAQSYDALVKRFRGVLREAARRAIQDESRIGAFLSGGTDSSTVTGLLGEITGKPPRTYSIGFSAEGFDEMEYARIASRHFHSESNEYYVKPQDVADAIPLIARGYDEPFGNASAVPTYFCARMAHADGIGVMLAGDGGDEIFGGNARYAWQKLFEPYGALPHVLRAGFIEPIVLGLPGGDSVAPWRKLKSYILQARIPLPDRLESYNFLQRSPLGEIFEADFLTRVNPAEPLVLHRQVYDRTESHSAIDRMMHLDLKFTLADNDLRKVRRMCEAAGVEVRFPLLDDALVEFSGEIPASLKVKGLKLRWFFKNALRDFLPGEILTKTKHGFGLPFGLWLREHKGLSVMAHESLDAFARRGIVRPEYIAHLLRQHETGHATYYGVMIWVLMMLEQWLAARKL